MGECRVCGTPILLEGRCYSCSTGAMDGYEAAVAERDRLAAENAELRKQHDAMWSRVDRHRDEIDVPSLCAEVDDLLATLAAANATLDEERAAYAALLESHEIILDALTESDAALDALREAVPEYDDEWQDWEPGDLMRLASAVYAILKPQPAALAEEKTNG